MTDYTNLPTNVKQTLETFFSVDLATLSDDQQTRYTRFSSAVRGEPSPELGWSTLDWEDLPRYFNTFFTYIEVLRLGIEAEGKPLKWSEEELTAVKLLVSHVPVRPEPPIDKKLKAEMKVAVKGLRNGRITERAFIFPLASYVVNESEDTVMCLPHNHDCSEKYPSEGRDFFIFKYHEEDSRLEETSRKGPSAGTPSKGFRRSLSKLFSRR